MTFEEVMDVLRGERAVLENIPEKKHHCIQLAVKTMHQGIEELKSGNAA